MMTAVIFVAVLALLVLTHEFGHFFVARKNGIKVEEFGFGFPPRILGLQRINKKNVIPDGQLSEKVQKSWRFVWGSDSDNENPAEETIYSLNFIPLGGFVKIKGEDGSFANDPDGFGHKKIWQRSLVIVSGVAMNFLLAAVLFSVGYMLGLPQIVDGGSDDVYIKDRRVEIAEVIVEKPAALAGVDVGDSVLSVGELNNPSPVEMQNYVNEHKTEEILVSLKRGNEVLEKSIIPAIYEGTDKAGFGVAIVEVGTVTYPVHKAIYYGVLTTGYYTKEIVVALAQFFKSLFVGESMAGEVVGPVGIAVMTGRMAKLGFTYLLQFTAVLSLHLALINILPIPALDGGRLVFLILEKIRKKPVTQRIEQATHSISFLLLMILIVLITVKDLGGIFSRFF